MSPACRACRVAAAIAVTVLLGLALGGRAEAERALTTADVQRFLTAGISEGTVLTELNARGFGEPLDQAAEATLRKAGASETLIVAIRRLAPAAPPPGAAPAPAAAGVAGGGATGATGIRDLTFNAATKTVRVPVSVLDSTGAPVLGLADRDFKVSEDGKPQQVSLFSSERRPLRIALALDESRSMRNKVRQVADALDHFIDILEPTDQIMVLTFSDEVQVMQDFTSDREKLRHVLDRLHADGPTSLYDAVYDSLQKVSAGPAESKAVVVVTDGVDTVSSVTLKTLREEARRAEVPVYSIGLDIPNVEDSVRRGGFPGGRGGGWGGGFPGGRWGGGRGGGGGGHAYGPREADFDAGPLKDLADDTGAQAIIVKGAATLGGDNPQMADHLKSAVETIATTLRYRYLLGYDPPTGKKKDWHTIQVAVDRPGAVARARKGYYTD
ncbi:MAG TPA: VWA domain-containing protein [Vicinamibacteria bacterium]|nr:VWA domain-containing protein [Vicinamibacteria bacterium]